MWLPWSSAADEVHLIKEEVHHRAFILSHSDPSLPFTSEVGVSQGLLSCLFSPGSSQQNFNYDGQLGSPCNKIGPGGLDISWIGVFLLLLFSQTTGEQHLEGPASTSSPSYTEVF